jgi:hypothetical protein
MSVSGSARSDRRSTDSVAQLPPRRPSHPLTLPPPSVDRRRNRAVVHGSSLAREASAPQLTRHRPSPPGARPLIPRPRSTPRSLPMPASPRLRGATASASHARRGAPAPPPRAPPPPAGPTTPQALPWGESGGGGRRAGACAAGVRDGRVSAARAPAVQPQVRPPGLGAHPLRQPRLQEVPLVALQR